jgi:uridylate kinase
MKSARIVLKLDGKAVPMNPFVRKVFINTIQGMVQSLNNVAKNPRKVQIVISKEVKE